MDGRVYKADISFFVNGEQMQDLDDVVRDLLYVSAGITRKYFIEDKEDDVVRLSFFIDCDDDYDFSCKLRTLLLATNYVTPFYYINDKGVA